MGKKMDDFEFNLMFFGSMFLGGIFIIVCILLSPIIIPIKYVINKFKKKKEICPMCSNCCECEEEVCYFTDNKE